MTTAGLRTFQTTATGTSDSIVLEASGSGSATADVTAIVGTDTLTVQIVFSEQVPVELASFGGELVENSYVAMLGKALEPLVRPLGFDWRAVAALFFGFLAKEIVVETFGILLGVEEQALTSAIAQIFTPVTGLAFMAFTLIYMPCVATIGVIYRETNSVKWTVFTVVYGLLLAYAVAFVIVSVGHALGYP